MSRFIPHPMLSAVLVLTWLLLTRFSLGHLVLGTGVALVAGWALSAIEPTGPRLRSIPAAVRLFGIVAADILRSNIAVAQLILTRGRHGQRQSGFVDIPLRMTDTRHLALLAIIVTATPGTAWIEYSPETGTLLLHVFDMKDPQEWRELIRDRYETLLMEAFA